MAVERKTPNLKKFLLFLCLITLLLLSLSGCGDQSEGDPSWQKIRDKGSILVGVSERNQPLTYRHSSGKITGFDVEAATEVCKRLNLSLELMVIDPADMEKNLQNGTIDCYWSGLPAPKREAEAVYGMTAAYLRNDDIFVLPAGSGIKNIAHLTGKRLGMIPGSSGAQALDLATQMKESLKSVEEYADVQSALSALSGGTVDVLVLSEAVARHYMLLNPDRYTILLAEDGKQPEPLNSQKCVIAVPHDSVSLRRQLENALSSMGKDGKIKELSVRYFGEDISITVQ